MSFTEMHVPPSSCPNCGGTIDAASNPEGTEPPAPGDVSVCIACSSILLFDEKLRMVLPSPAVLDELLAEEPRLLDYVQAATEARNDAQAESP